MRQFMPVLLSVLLISGCDEGRDPAATADASAKPAPVATPATPAAPAAPAAPAVTPAPAVAPKPAAPVPVVVVPVPAAQSGVPTPPAFPPATLARAGSGEPHWLSTGGWKSGPVEHGNPAQVRVLAESDGAGPRAIEVTVTGGAKDKAAISHPLVKEDLAEHPALAFTVSNTGDRPIHLSVAIKTKNWLYHESTVCVIPAKTTAPIPLSYDLEAPVFRTLASKWEPTSAISDLGEMKEIQVVILNGPHDGKVVIADVKLMPQVAK